MRLLVNLVSIIAIAALFAACKKVDDLPMYGRGTAPTLTASATTVAPPAADSNNVVLSLGWTNPKYATDSSNYKFTVEIDSAGKNFSRPDTKVVMGGSGTTFTGKELNNFLLGRGYAFNVPVDMDVRVISSYANNNERLTSNVIRIKMTPYKIPPKVALPTSGRLFIVGDATTFGWSNDPTPPFPPAREFARLDETTWGGIFYMNGSGAYKILQTQGVWSTQYHMVAAGSNATAGTFVLEDADPGFPSPSTAGWYKITLDFQSGRYTVDPVANPLPQELYITGDATVGGWSNTPPAAQKFNRLNSVEYEITNLSFVPNKAYKFLSSSGNWQPQFGGNSATGGVLGANYGSSGDPDAIPTPSVAGTYKIRVNFFTNRYAVTQ